VIAIDFWRFQRTAWRGREADHIGGGSDDGAMGGRGRFASVSWPRLAMCGSNGMVWMCSIPWH
jgi:hypothetical protein